MVVFRVNIAGRNVSSLHVWFVNVCRKTLFYISANFTDTDIHHTDKHTDTDTNYPAWIHIKPIPILIIDIGIGYTDLADY